MPFPPRPAQTRVKHEIVNEYSGAWASIIVNGVKNSRSARQLGFVLDLVYVEGFAGFGRYCGDVDQPHDHAPVWGSPVIGLSQLEAVSTAERNRGIAIRVTGILVDLNREGQIEELEENLSAAAIVTPITRLTNATGIRKGHVNLISGDFRDHVDGILDSVDQTDFVLAFLDPYGESMRMDSLTRIVGRRRTDSILLFPTARVDRLGGSLAKQPRHRESQDNLNVERIDQLYGSTKWQEIPTDLKLTREEREIAYGTLYRSHITAIDEGLWVKNIALRFPKMNREAYSLLLTTRDADGGMRMNEILRRAEARKHWLLWADHEAQLRSHDEEQGLGDLFPDMPRASPPTIEPETIGKEVIIPSILNVVFPGEELEYKTLLGRLFDTAYVPREINSALRFLRDQQQFAFSQLRKGSTLRRLR